MSDLAKRLASLSPEKRGLLLKQLKKKQEGQTQALIVPQKREVLPLSFAQQRLWFLDQLEPLSSFYNMPAVLRLSGSLDIQALQRSLSSVVQRHEVLRTTFRELDGRPMQVIAASKDTQFPLLDLSSLDFERRDDTALSLAQQEARRPFDLTVGPLLRAFLLKLDAQEHILLLTLHHITSDGWSLGVLIRELAVFFQAETKGIPAALPPLPIQYADYALWQHQWLQGDVLQEQLDYWRQHLRGVPTLLHLPTDHPRPPVQTYLGAAQSLLLPSELVQELNALNLREETTLFMTLLAAFTVLLMHYSGQQDIVVGTPIANRTRSELKGLIGFFVNMLALRTDLSANPSFRGLLAQVRESTLKAFEHQDMPFEKLVESLQLERVPGYSPLFQVLFAVQNVPQASLEEGLGSSELSWRSVGLGHTTSRFDMEFSLYETSKGLNTVLIYNTTLFEASTIERFLQHWLVLLRAIVRDVRQPVFSLPVMTMAERTLLLEMGHTAQSYHPENDNLSALFEAQVALMPDAIAAFYEEQVLTYDELNRRANQLAHLLHTRGVGPDVVVGICLDRSFSLLIALLAVLKAGGAYLPLDPAYPLNRLAYMLQDAGASVVLTSTVLQERLPIDSPGLVCIDEEELCLQRESSENLHQPVLPEHLVYLIYTSGSTGLPKGTGVTRRGFGNLLDWFLRDCGFTQEARVLVATSFSFDLTQKNLLAPLLAGGSVTLFPSGYYDPRLVCQTIMQHAITFLNCVPGMLYPLLEENQPQKFAALSSLQRVFTGGEALSLSRLLEWLRSPNCQAQIISAYGPTECADIVSFMYLERPEQYLSLVVPIGRPIPGTRMYLLDAWGNLALQGAIGELYVGGEGVARGYMGRADLTAERFVPDPFSGEAGARLYRTGDLVRYRLDGLLEFVGRVDHQVKIHGMRVELGEIETALQAHPQVRDAVLIVHEDERSEYKSLVAYVTGEVGAKLTGSTLQIHLRQRLPDHMVPAQFVMLDVLPRTPNGKVDRRALPSPDMTLLSENALFVAPRTPLEELLAQIWVELLNQPQIGIHENFFALGGHSLLATQVASRIRQVLQMELPLRTLFEAPTIIELAQWIEAHRYGPHYEVIPAILPVERTAESELSFAQERLWFLYQLEPHSAFYTMPFVLRPIGQFSVIALERSLSIMIQRHEILRTTFAVRQDQPVQIVAPARTAVYSQGEINICPYPLPVIDLSGLDHTEQEIQVHLLVQQEARHPFDLAVGPLLRSSLLRLSTQEHILVFLMHHIISDGWSMGVLMRELSALYRSSLNGESSPLPALSLQYADYAHWQRQWLQGKVLQAQLDYWRQHLTDTPKLLNLPTDRPRPALQSYEGRRAMHILPSYVSQALVALSQREGVTLYMTLLAAYQVLLLRYSGQSDILVGTPIANRTRGEVEDLIGFFVNTLVMRTDLSGNPGFRQLLARVREVALGAFAHQDLPFEKLVDSLQIERSPSYAPLFQVFFALQNTPQTDVSLPDLSFLPITLEHTTARFDLAFDLRMTGQGLRTSVEYVTALFDEATIQRLLGHWQVLLEAIVSDANQPIEQLPLLSPPEWEQLRTRWYVTDGVHRSDVTCLHHLFEQQAERVPDAIALSFEEQSLTYRELNQRANQLAHHLRMLGVGSEMPVGICVERSLTMVIGLLAILKAGGVFVPLDPSYPKDRLSFMLEDAQPAIVLTQTSLLPILSATQNQALCLDEVWEKIKPQPITHPSFTLSPENLAYMIYTSGSTGQPKGTMNTHRGICNNMLWKQEMCVFTPADSIIQRAPLSFDASIEEIFLPLMSGGRLVIARPEGHKDSAYLVSLLKEQAITALSSVPSLLQVLLEERDMLDCQHLRLVLCGGEAMPPELPARLFRSVPANLYNLYGPTETAIQVTCWTCRRESPQEGRVPIGYPIANTQVYLLDAHLQPVPLGIAGEVYLGGMNLGRGYFNRPDVTSERFLPHPFALNSGERLYRTGDLGRYRADGAIDYLGRVDQQVKVRGVRIELGEIEAALNQHPAVQECVVVVREDVPGDQRLIAYVVPAFDSQEVTEVASSWADEHIGQWQAFYNETYRIAKDIQDPTLNIFGYTGEPIPSEEMREQIDQAVERILERGPERVMEIGCGTGLLLFRVAPHCREYVASDFSHEALAYVQQVLLTHPCSQVTLTHQQAHEALQAPPESFDAIILNSVLQYFPDIHYVVCILTDALTALKAGGFLFLGDVRNLALQKAYVTSVEVYRARSSLTCEEVRLSVQQRILEEEELLLDPAFFSLLQRELPQIGQVQVLLKRGHASNELTRFRYDVILRKAATEAVVAEERIVWDWQQGDVTFDRVERFLYAGAPLSLRIEHVPNTRLTKELQQVAWVFGEQGPDTVKVLRAELDRQTLHELDPEDFWGLGERLGYRVTVNWSPEGDGGYYDVLFSKGKEIQTLRDDPASLPKQDTRSTPRWLNYANNPLQGKMTRTLIPQLRSFLKTQLVEYALPSHYVILESLPLTPNGKVDRRALPAPDHGFTASRKTFVAPHTRLQDDLATIWTELLRISQISIHDNFFELGGHSLLATQVISRLRTTFQVEMPLRSLFENPTIAQLAQLIEPLQRIDSSLHRPQLLVQTRPAVLPLSFAQERLWFLDQLEPLSTRYRMLAALRLSGPLSISALEKSLNHIVQRHEVLRTTFALRDGLPSQVIVPALILPLPLFDLCGLHSEEREIKIRRLIEQEACRPFDLERGPLLRAAMMRLGPQEHILLFNQHHIVSDGWSVNVLVQELNALYLAYRTDQSINLPALSIQYADYALWQRQWLQGEVLQSQLDYWRRQLTDAPAVLNMPTDRPRPAVQTSAGANISRLLPVELLHSLQRVSQQEDATLFMTLLATLGVLLQRYSGQDDIVVGSPIANRSQAEVEALIGFFVNTLALRLDLSGNPSFRLLLERVREVTLHAYMYQEIPFEKLVEELRPERSLSYSPLFQVLFTLQNTPEVSLKMDEELSVQTVAFEQTTSTFDLSIQVNEARQGLSITVTYNTDLFDAATIVGLLDHWHVLLQGVVADPLQSITELPLLTEEERATLLAGWNATQQSWDDSIGTIHDVIAAQVQLTPERVALVCGEHQMTYQMVQHASTGLARYLMRLGVEQGNRLGLYLERNELLPIALLAILQLGASYVPMDPLYPRERLAFLLHDAQVRFVLTQQALEPHLLGLGSLSVCLDHAWEKMTFLPSEQEEREPLPLPSVDPAQIAYTIYTSGSTGTPKGVQITHRAVLNLLYAMQRQPGIHEYDVLLAVTTIAFDIAALEVFAPLSVGARLVVADASVSMDGRLLAQKLAQEAVTVVQATPTTWQMLVGQGWDGKIPLKILCGGEALPPRLAAFLLQCGVQLWNMYGPTETTIWSTCSQVISGKEITLGHPIANTQLYLLDSDLHLVPVGVSGEVYLGGVGLAQGYWQRADLTAERFVPHPLSREPGVRLYRTGDLARYRGDGSLEYLGRSDHQIKLRGFRIELGEIEAALQDYPPIQEAVVILREHEELKNLLAYLVVRPGEELLLDELRAQLHQRLPNYMLPTHFLVLERLPVTPNGKVDRKSLPDPEQTISLQSESSVAPRTHTEEVLATLWKELLKVPRVGISDNFFDLGGHSLLAVQLLNAMNQRFNVTFSLAMLFQFPTIEQVASLLSQQRPSLALSAASPIVPIHVHGSHSPLFVVHPLSGDLSSYLSLTQYLSQDRPVYGIQAIGLIDGQKPVIGIEEMAKVYVDALLQVQPDGPYILGGHSLGGLIALEMARRLQTQERVVSLLILMDSRFTPESTSVSGPFDETRWLIEVIRTLESYRGLPGSSPSAFYAELWHREPDDQLRYLLKRVKTAQIVPHETDLAAFRRLLHVVRANTDSLRTYHPSEIYQGDVVFLTCEEKEYDPRSLWQPYLANPLDIQTVSGNHFSMLAEPHVRALAAQLQWYLDQH